MCLGDLRFMPYVMPGKVVTYTGIVAEHFLTPNPNRVAWWAWRDATNALYIHPLENAAATNFTFNKLDNAVNPYRWFCTLIDDGPIVGMDWFATAFAGANFKVIEFTVPERIMAEIREMGIR